MGTNCAPLLADLFLYSYEAEFVQNLLQAGKKHLAQQFNFTYRYIDDVLSLKNTKFAEYLEFIYPRELELWLGPPWFNYWFSFTLAYSRISHEYSSLFIIVINLIFMFSLWCIDWVGSLYANRIFMYFCIKGSIGTQGEVS